MVSDNDDSFRFAKQELRNERKMIVVVMAVMAVVAAVVVMVVMVVVFVMEVEVEVEAVDGVVAKIDVDVDAVVVDVDVVDVVDDAAVGRGPATLRCVVEGGLMNCVTGGLDATGLGATGLGATGLDEPSDTKHLTTFGTQPILDGGSEIQNL